MSEYAVKVENLSKRYRIGLKEERPETLVAAMTSWLKSPIALFAFACACLSAAIFKQ